MAIKATKHAKTQAKPAPVKGPARSAGRASSPTQAGARPPMADRRSRILDVAARRFAEHGFEATTVREIADDVNILSGSLYHHFATKDEMLHEIVRDAVIQMRDNTIRISKAPVDAEHRLVALILLDLGELTRNQEVHRILYNERKLFRHNPEFAYVLKAKKDAFHAWEAVLRDGIKAKLFKPDLDIYLTISTTLRMLNTAADWYKNEDRSVVGGYTLDQLIDYWRAFILSAVRAPARASAPIPHEACEELAKFQV